MRLFSRGGAHAARRYGATLSTPLILGLAMGPELAAQAVVNAPVAPEAIYVGYADAQGGVSVIDLNGFGQGTGDLAKTNFPTNPNIGLPGVFPQLAPGTSSMDAGGAGQWTLTEDTDGNVRHAVGTAGRVVDLQIGQPLDLVYNNEAINRNATRFNQVNPFTGVVSPGNTISVAPHPNPPRLVFPAPHAAMRIEAEEPTVTSNTGPSRAITRGVPCMVSPINLLVPGMFGLPGLLATTFPGQFYGPQAPPPSPPPPTPFCPFSSRQQIGHFLYALDREGGRVVVLNSNRMWQLAELALNRPTSMALSPNLKWLAVSSARNGHVNIIDIDPSSRNFHRVIAQTVVGRGASGLAWQPEAEELLVCNAADSSVTIVDGRDFSVRKTITRQIRRPIDVAVTARQNGIGHNTGTYFAWILNRDGSVALYESGGGVSGAGNVVAVSPRVFRNPRAIQPDMANLSSGCWITHQDSEGLGQVSRVELASVGTLICCPETNYRIKVAQRLGGIGSGPGAFRDLLSGNNPVDLAFDELVNQGALPDMVSTVVTGLPTNPHSGKGQVKRSTSGTQVRAVVPNTIFIALRDVGKVDVFEISSGRKLRTIDAPGVRSLGHYWRQ
ncbi:MAG: hypothetical protein AAF628_20820 [Planctomycetota bacterium]